MRRAFPTAPAIRQIDLGLYKVASIWQRETRYYLIFSDIRWHESCVSMRKGYPVKCRIALTSYPIDQKSQISRKVGKPNFDICCSVTRGIWLNSKDQGLIAISGSVFGKLHLHVPLNAFSHSHLTFFQETVCSGR